MFDRLRVWEMTTRKRVADAPGGRDVERAWRRFLGGRIGWIGGLWRP